MSLKTSLNHTTVESNSKRKRSLEYEIRKACLNGNLEKAMEHLNDSEVLNIDELDRTKILFHALKSSDLSFVERLLEIGCNVNIMNENGRSALYLAIHAEMFQIAELLAKNGAIYVGKGYEDHVSNILHDASSEGYFQVCKIVLENGASVDGGVDPMSPLHFAAEEEYLDILELLIKHGANVNYRDEDNITPFNGAVRYNHAEVVQRFFELGTNLDLNIRNDYGNTAFEDAVDSKKTFGRVGKLMIFQEHIKYH